MSTGKSATLFVSRDDISIVISNCRPVLEEVSGKLMFDLSEECDCEGWQVIDVGDFEELFSWMCDTPELYEIIQVNVQSRSSESLGIHSLIAHEEVE